ncbi:MAG: hypothetical protein AAF531_25780 [Actinomycetota bacterium]
MAGPVGRLMRWGDSGWSPVGEPLPPFAHAPPAPQLLLAPWVLPQDPPPRAYDILVIGELAHQLVTRCERDDPIYAELAEQTMLLNGREATLAWLAEIEVWIGRRLDPGRDWPAPPSGGA